MWCWIGGVDRRLKSIEERLERMEGVLRNIRFMVSRPQSLGIVVVKEIPMKGYQFGLILPVRPEEDVKWADVDHGQLTVTLPTGDVTFVTTKDMQLTEDRVFTDDTLVVPGETPVKAEFAYVDAVGNVSVNPVTAEGVIRDTIPPVDPAELGFITIREVELPDPEPEPEPEPEA